MTYYSALHYAAKAEAAATTATTLLPYLTDITTVANNIVSVNTVSADISSITTAATNIASINTVATNISDISAVVSNATNINTVATNISDVNTVATDISNVNSVASDLTNIDAVNANKTNIDAVAGNETNINAVNANKTNIDTVAGIASDVTTVAGIASDITDVKNNAADISTVAGVSSDVSTVASISSDVSSVASNNTDISSVAADLSNINAVAADLTNIDNVAGDLTSINDVASDLTNIDAVNANKTNIDTVAGISSNVTTVAGISSDVTSVAGNNTDISSVAADLTNINAVAGDLTNIDSVAGNATNINAVNANKTNIDTVAGISSNVTTVAGDITNVNAVASDLTNINAVAADLTNIDNASQYAAEAKQYAIGDPSEPAGNSAKYWAQQASTLLSSKQDQLTSANAGTGISITGSGGNITINNTQTSAEWGNITGTLSSQTDLQNALNAKYDASNPNGYTSNVGTVTSVNNTSPDGNGNVTLSIPAAQVNSDWNANSGVAEILNKPSLATVATSGSYNDLSNKPTIPTVNNSTITITQGGVTKGSFTLNQASGDTIALDSGGSLIDIDNKSITKNASDELQTVGVINSRDSSTAIKTWTGTKAQYDAIVTKDANTLYNITDDAEVLDTRALGQIITSTIPLTDAGLHLLDGSVINGSGAYAGFVDYVAGLVSTYPDLFCTEADWQTSVSTYGVCGKFVYDSNTVRLPKITGFVEGTTTVSAIGDLIQAGLPNITGQIAGSIKGDYSGLNGAFTGAYAYGTSYAYGTGGYGLHNAFGFNASNSNPIYGNSTTVQPQAIKVLYYIVIATSTKTNIEVDIDEIATDLNGKADTDLGNVDGAGQYNLIQYVLSNLQTTDNTKVGYLYIVNGGSASVYAPSGGKWLVLRNEQISDSTAVKYSFGSGELGKYTGTIVDGGEQVAAYSSQVSGASCKIYVTLLKIV